MNTATQRAIDPDRVHAHAIKMVTELGAAAMGSLVLIGDELGLYRALADGRWMLVEPMAQDDLPGNLNPVGRVDSAFSPACAARPRRRSTWCWRRAPERGGDRWRSTDRAAESPRWATES